MTTFVPPPTRHRRNRDEPLQPCSVPDCPDPLGGPTLTPDGLPHRFCLTKIGIQGFACGKCYDRLRVRHKRQTGLKTIEPCVVPGCHNPAGKFDFEGRRPGRFDLEKLGTGMVGKACQSCFSRLLHAERKRQAEANGREYTRLEIVPVQRAHEHVNTKRAKPRPVKAACDSPLWGCRLAAAWKRRDWDKAVGTSSWEEEEE